MHHTALQDELSRCYTEQANHFVQTRKKSWPEWEIIRKALATYDGVAPHVVDLGVWGGRSVEIVKAVFPRYAYVGVDLAPGMIDVAQSTYPTEQWVVAEMITYLQWLPQESVDIVLGIASFQHLASPRERALLFAELYRVLRRWGMLIAVNRSFSEWFRKHYRKAYLGSAHRLLRDRHRRRNDCLIPWKDPAYEHNRRLYQRYYHLFTLSELRDLASCHGFVIRELCYSSQQGEKTTDWRQSRNSFLVAEKNTA